MLPDPILTIGDSIEIYMYGVMIAVGILSTFIVLFLYSRWLHFDSDFIDFVFYNGIVAIIVGFGSAALFQAVYNYIEDPSAGFHLIGGGITFIGGLIGGIISFLVGYFLFGGGYLRFNKKYKTNLTDFLSTAPPCILIAHAFGRIGCFCAGCCYGKVTDGPLGVKFPELAEKVYPTNLYEAIFLFIMFGVCTFLLFRFRYRHNLALYLVSYGLFRFFIEYLRGDYRGSFIPGITPSQFWSILMVIAGVGVYFLCRLYLYPRRDAALAARAEAEQEAERPDAPASDEEPPAKND